MERSSPEPSPGVGPGSRILGVFSVREGIHKILDSYPGLTTEVLTFLGDRIGESLSGETAALAIGADDDGTPAAGDELA